MTCPERCAQTRRVIHAAPFNVCRHLGGAHDAGEVEIDVGWPPLRAGDMVYSSVRVTNGPTQPPAAVRTL